MKNIKQTHSVIPENSKNLSGIYKILKEKLFNRIQGRFLFSKEGQNNILKTKDYKLKTTSSKSLSFYVSNKLNSNKLTNSLKTKDYKLKTNFGFTLVELIVVITILAILGTIAFVSFGSYSSSARDSGRMADLTNISKGLALQYTTSGILPYPDGYITVNAGTGYSMYQGTVGKTTLGIIKMSDAKDNLDNTYYSYSTNQSRTQYSVGGYLENQPTTAFNDILNSNLANAADYSKRYLLIKGNTVGILSESGTNLPIEQTTTAGTGINLLTTDKNLILNISSNVSTTGNNIINGTGLIVGAIQTSTINNGNYTAPTNCPAGFIAVPGNRDFNQPGFCVAKYEMSYEDATSPTSGTNSANKDPNAAAYDGTQDWNTMDYIVGKTPVSQAGLYPIANITQKSAIEACAKIGSGYHLITNNEWMTIARNIEANPNNWSSGIIGSGYIYNGVSNSTMGCNGATNTIYTLPRTRASKTGEGFGNINCDNSRKHILSNGQVIYDLAGNIREHVNKANTFDTTNIDSNSFSTESACNGTLPTGTFAWYSWYSNDGVAECGFINGYSRQLYGPSGNYNASNGVGRIYATNTEDRNNVFLRGGDAWAGADSGVFTLHLGWSSADALRSVGFRCAK